MRVAIVVAGAALTGAITAGPALASTTGGNGTSGAPSGARPAPAPLLRPLAPVTQALAGGTAATGGGGTWSPAASNAGTSSGGAGGGGWSSTSSGYSGYGGAGYSSARGMAGDFNPSSGTYTEPLHGTNPHGEGTGLALTTEPRPTPDSNNCDAPAKDEILVVGRSCGQQNSDGSYNGHVTILALGGQELLGQNSTSSGSTTTGSLAPLAGPLVSGLNSALSKVCSGSSQNICLSLLAANSSTSSSGSNNSFQAASLAIGGSKGLSVAVLGSNGNISQSGGCQSASGSSSLANLSGGGTTIVNAADSSDSSTACQDSSKNSQTSSSHVLGGAIAPVTSPVLGGNGCAAGTPNTQVKLLGQIPIPGQVLAAYCNATDSNGAQAAAPYGTNDGLTAVVLGGVGLQTPATESLARAPAAGPSTSPATGSAPPPAAPAAPPVASPAPVAPIAATAHQKLPFTGLNLVLELLIAAALFGAGAILWFASRRRVA